MRDTPRVVPEGLYDCCSRFGNLLANLGRLIGTYEIDARIKSLEDLVCGSGLAAKPIELEAGDEDEPS